jgi:hypothetical protein
MEKDNYRQKISFMKENLLKICLKAKEKFYTYLTIVPMKELSEGIYLMVLAAKFLVKKFMKGFGKTIK